MVTQMTNRLLATVMGFAVSTGLVAHAAQDPHHPLPGVTVTQLQAPEVSLRKVTGPRITVTTASLPAAGSLPQAVATAASHVNQIATTAVDPNAALRAAFQRDHVALEHLRQMAARLKGRSHQAFNQRVSDSEATLVEIEKAALASRSGAAASIKEMDDLVAAGKASLDREQRQSGDNGAGDQQSGDHNLKSND